MFLRESCSCFQQGKAWEQLSRAERLDSSSRPPQLLLCPLRQRVYELSLLHEQYEAGQPKWTLRMVGVWEVVGIAVAVEIWILL